MKREFLEKLGLESEAIEKIMAENGKDVQAEIAKAEAITKKVDSLEMEKKNLEEQIATANDTIESFKKMDIEEVQAKAEEYKGKYEQALADHEAYKQDVLLSEKLNGFNTLDADVLKKLIDMDSLKFKDGEIKGLEEQVKTLQKDKPYLFQAEQEQEEESQDERFESYTPPNGEGGGGSKDVWADLASKYQ